MPDAQTLDEANKKTQCRKPHSRKPDVQNHFLQWLLPEACSQAITFTQSTATLLICCANIRSHCNYYSIGRKDYSLKLQIYAQSAKVTFSAATRKSFLFSSEYNTNNLISSAFRQHFPKAITFLVSLITLYTKSPFSVRPLRTFGQIVPVRSLECGCAL